MARYTGAVCRLCRRYGEKLYLKGDRCFGPKCSFTKRPTPPGGGTQRRRKVSDRGLQLRREAAGASAVRSDGEAVPQLLRRSAATHGVTGDLLIRSLETRLDNVVYRLGFADSRKQARQLVRHGHIALNDRKTDIPSAQVKLGDTVAFTPRGAKTEYAKIGPGDAAIQAGALLAVARHGSDEGPGHRRADAGIGRVFLRPERDRGVLLPVTIRVSVRQTGRNWQVFPPAIMYWLYSCHQEVLSSDNGC